MAIAERNEPLRLTYASVCHDPNFRFHIENSVFPTHSCQVHSHEFAEIVIVRHGRGRHLIDGADYRTEAGDIFVVRPDDVHGYEDIEGLDLCNIIFDPDEFLAGQPVLDGLPGFHMLFHLEPIYRHNHKFHSKLQLTREALRHVYDLVESMRHEYHGREPGYEASVRAYLVLLIVLLSRQYVQQEHAGVRELFRLSDVHAYLQSHYDQPITLDQLAAQAHVSKNTLLRAFQRCYNQSPISYLIQLRLAKARDLLREPGVSITEVAHRVGFADLSHFSRTFRKTYGQWPSDFRKKIAPG